MAEKIWNVLVFEENLQFIFWSEKLGQVMKSFVWGIVNLAKTVANIWEIKRQLQDYCTSPQFSGFTIVLFNFCLFMWHLLQ